MAFAFEKLLVYHKSVDFADAVCTATEQFQRAYGFLVDQLNRAALSISSNIAEGNGRFTKADRKHFIDIARGSIQECVPPHIPVMKRLMGKPSSDRIPFRVASSPGSFASPDVCQRHGSMLPAI